MLPAVQERALELWLPSRPLVLTLAPTRMLVPPTRMLVPVRSRALLRWSYVLADTDPAPTRAAQEGSSEVELRTEDVQVEVFPCGRGGRAARQHDRERGAPDAQADGHQGELPGPNPDAEPS